MKENKSATINEKSEKKEKISRISLFVLCLPVCLWIQGGANISTERATGQKTLQQSQLFGLSDRLQFSI